MSVIGLHLLNAVGGGTLLRDSPTGVKGKFAQNYVVIDAFPIRRPFAPSGSDMILAQRLETKVTHITYCQPDKDVQRGDRLTIENITYEVTAVLPPSKPHHLKLMLERREYGATV
jgi:hypothetical protein